MRDDFPKGGIIGPGKSFLEQRAQRRAGVDVPKGHSMDGGKTGPRPADLHGSLQPQHVRSTVTKSPVGQTDPPSQTKYGSHRERTAAHGPIVPPVPPGFGNRGR